MKKIKIAQVGISHEHALGKMIALRRLPELFEIVGVVDDTASTAAKSPSYCMDVYKDLPWMTEEELFRYPGLQAVAVETPNSDLVPTAIRCAQHNLAMHLDKPAGEDLPLFEHFLKECEKRNVPVQMGYMFRSNPAMQLCRKAVREGWLGEIFEIQASMSHNYGGDAYQTYLGNFKGGIMFNLGCHFIDLIVSMMGRPEKITPFMKSAGEVPDSVKNNCLTILEYPRATVTLRACSLEADGLARRRLKVCGTKGSVELCPLERFDGKPLEMSLILKEGNAEFEAGTHIVDCGTTADRYEAQLNEFAKIVNGEMKNPYTYEHDYLVQQVTLAASGYSKWR